MNSVKLVTMANQIGAFFAAESDQEHAVGEIVAHLKRTWDPRMRRELVACLQTAEGAALAPLTRRAVECMAQ